MKRGGEIMPVMRLKGTGIMLALVLCGACSRGGPATEKKPPAKPAAVDAGRIVHADAEPGNWMTTGRTYGEQRYSPL
ncbi:MAG TPA: hypothetical protein VMH28_35140, partial [Candidatus Acidoferrales bacterium]|nr:hypothetical protein [Candidatus Acidoferrales bacterium]